MRTTMVLIISLSLVLTAGCANSPPPKVERMKLPSKTGETTPPPPPEEKLKELVIPQRENAKKIQEKRFSFFARDVNVQDVLLAFSKEDDLNIVLEPELSGKVTIDLKRVTLKEALDAILTPLGWTYRIDGKFVNISRPRMESRLFTLNYTATRRTGKREVYASSSSGGGLQAGTTPGQQSGINQGQQATFSSGGQRTGYTDVISTDGVDLWREIHRGLEAIVFGPVEEVERQASFDREIVTWTRADGNGKKLIVNRSTGVIWVTDYPANLNKIASYLETIEGSSQRQVTIHAKILEVNLSDEFREGINWEIIEGLPRSINLAWGLTDKLGKLGFPGTPDGYLTGTGGTGTTTSTIQTPGVFKISPYGGILAVGGAGTEVRLSDIMEAISKQGDLRTLSSPTLSTLNNQKAIIRVGNQDVYFVTGAVATQNTVTQFIQPMTIDIGIILDVTPQIAEDGTIIMNIHPSITDKTGEKLAPDGKSTFPLLSVRETDTTVRVRDGQTIIIAGLMQERTEPSYIGVPVLQSTPLVGGLFRYKKETKKNSELVIMITPILQIGKRVEDFSMK
jgi:MSHA biogenesis protein MshL